MTPAELENQRQIRLLELQSDLRDHLYEQITHPNARARMASFVGQAPSAQAYIRDVGPRPTMAELAAEVDATEDGRSLRRVLREHADADRARVAGDPAARWAAIESIVDLEERLTAYRAAGGRL